MRQSLVKILILATASLIVSLRINSQTFTDSGIPLIGLAQGSVSWGDYDNDGKLDILLTGNSNSVGRLAKIYHNAGYNTFIPQDGIELTGVYLSSSAWGDYDNDGDLDILITGDSNSGPISKIYKNNGDGTFTEQISIALPGIMSGSVAWGDYDNDGDLDLLLCGYTSPGFISKIFRNDGSVKFTEITGISLTGVRQGSASWGDYDNDGDLDILLTGNSSSIFTSKIYRNDGNNIFTEQTEIILPQVCYSSSAWGDYDGDGYLDILITGDSMSGRVSKIYRNNGNGSFYEQTQIVLAGVWNGSVAWGDYDNDGDLDILLTGAVDYSNNSISGIYKNNGDNSFTFQADMGLQGVFSSSVAWGDYDNDDDLDILLTGFDKSYNFITKIYTNNFSAKNYPPAKPVNLQIQINKREALLQWDNVLTDETNYKSLTYNVRIGRKSEENNFVPSHSSSTGFRKTASMGNSQLGNNFIYRNLFWDTVYYTSVQAVDNSFKGGEFSDEVQFSLNEIQPSALHASNINSSSILVKWVRGNGERCILFVKEGTSGLAAPQNKTTYYANNVFGEGSPLGDWFCVYKGIADSVILTGLDPSKNYRVHAIEFMGGSESEIYADIQASSNVGIFASGLFIEQVGIPLNGVSYGSGCWGDYNNDGYLDVLLTGSSSTGRISNIYRNNGNNTFSIQDGIGLTGVWESSSAWGDYNNDGRLDILITGNSGDNMGDALISKVYRNNGNNTFTDTAIPLSGSEWGNSDWGDYDNDGNIDMIITGMYSSKIYKNVYTLTFSELTEIPLLQAAQNSATWGDYDRDGDLDLLVIGYANPNTVIYENDGQNNLTLKTDILLENTLNGFADWGDYDNDGNLDILLTGYAASGCITKLYHNNGDKTFTEQNNLAFTGIQSSSGEWFDYNNDGNLDFVLTGETSSITPVSFLYRNDGNGNFSPLSENLLPKVRYGSVASADYDNDGDLDLLFTGMDESNQSISKIYRNNLIMNTGSPEPNQLPHAPTGLRSTVLPGMTELTWNPVNDDETPTKTMSYNLRYKLLSSTNWLAAPQAADNGFRREPSLGNLQLNTSFALKNLPTGTYTWQVQAIDQAYAGGPWSEVSTFVVRNVQAFFSADEVCLGLATTFTDESVATAGKASWNWDFADGTFSTYQNPAHTYAQSGTYNVKLTITDTQGTTDALTQPVVVKPKPLTEFNAISVCQGIPVTATNLTNENGLTISSWNWDFGDGSSSTEQQPAPHPYLVVNDYAIKLKAAASNGCADSASKVVSVGSYPVAAVTSSGPLTFCKGDSIILSVQFVPGYSYTWKTSGTNLTGATETTYKARNSGIYSAEIVNPKGNCLSTSPPVTINVLDAPSAPLISVEGNLAFCQGDSAILSVNPVPGYTYDWKLNGGSLSTFRSYICARSSGEYTLSVSNSSGCSVISVNKITINVRSKPSPRTISTSGVTTFCHGNSVTLNVSPEDGCTYTWKKDNIPLSGAVSNSFVAGITGLYMLDISNASGCTFNTAPVNVLVKQSPLKPVLEPSNYTKGNCPGENPVRLSSDQVIAGYKYQWSKNSQVQVSDTLPYIEFYEAGNYQLTADLNGCEAASDLFTTEFPSGPAKPVIYAEGPTYWYLACSNMEAQSYKWYWNGKLVENATKYYYVASQKLGVYQVSVGDKNGCFTKSDPVSVPPDYATAIENSDPFTDLQIYPNPTPGLFTIEMDNNVFGELSIDIFNQPGSKVLNIKFDKTTEHFKSQIDLSGQAKGMYMINFFLERYFATRKIMVE